MSETTKQIERLLYRIIHLKALKRSFYSTYRDRQRYDEGLLETYCELTSLGYSGDFP